jgi:hypothetical protein
MTYRQASAIVARYCAQRRRETHPDPDRAQIYMEVTMDWWGWVILAVVVLLILITLAVVVQRRRRRGGVIGLGGPGSASSGRNDRR